MSLVKFKKKDIYRNEAKILEGVDLEVNSGDFILFSGISGSGKSTLIDEIVESRDDLTGRVFQDSTQQFTMETPFLELVFLYENLQVKSDEIKEKTLNILKKYDLLAKKDQNVLTLSGGEQQRLMLAEAIETKSNLIILDEPFASVDNKNAAKLIKQIEIAYKSGVTFIVADHNPSLYKKLINKIYVFSDGSVNKVDDKAFKKILKSSTKTILKSTNSNKPAITFRNFILKNLIEESNLSIPENSKTLLVGENGSGKSTLVKALFELSDFKGTIEIKNKTKLIAFQHSEDSFLEVIVKDEVSFAKENIFRKGDYLNLDYFELFANNQQSVYTLSGGEQKKLQLYSLLIQNTDLLVLDEPFAGLDETSVKNVLGLIDKFNGTVLVVSHIFTGFERVFDNVIEIKNKKLKQVTEIEL